MNNKTLTLTIVIPVYNEQGYLKACLDSIAKQTVMPDEVIVVDNNSTDKSAQIASAYPFVRLINETKQGVVFARNTGFNAAKSDIIGRIDADTVIPVNWIRNAKEIYVQAGAPELYAVTAPSNFRNRGWSIFWYVMHRLTYFWPSRLLLGHTTFVGSNMLITRQLWKQVRANVCLRTDIHEDMDLALHVGRMGTPILFQPILKSSVLARRMFFRSISYPVMMIKLKFVSH
jgi:glycosyltransferase involved in cell wall biosynthesis